MATPDQVLVGSYDYQLVALSVLVSMLAAWAALDLAGRVTAAQGSIRLAWLLGGSTASGIGTWSMHYTGMLAFSLPVPVQYDWPTVLLSLLPAIFASAVALYVIGRSKIELFRPFAAGISMGGGIAGLHYVAMEAMRLPAMCHYSPPLVILSVILAIASSLLALWLTFLFRHEPSDQRLRKALSVLAMGAANPLMHYTGMAATSFTRSGVTPDLSHAVSISLVSIEGITLVPIMVLAVALVTSLVDRLQKAKSLLDELFEQAPQAVALLNADDRVVRVNREFARIFGYTPQETLGRRLSELTVPDELRVEYQRYAESSLQGQRVEAEVVRKRKDGSRLNASVIRVPVTVPGGQVEIYAIYRDITERKRAEQELRASREQLRALAAYLQSVREEERARISRELHDEIGAGLTAIKLALERSASEPPSRVATDLARALALAKELIGKVRDLSLVLRPAMLDDLGLLAALRWHFERYTDQFKIAVDFKHSGLTDRRFSPETETAVYRIVQETLTNVARHAKTDKVAVEIHADENLLRVRIKDEGIGFDPHSLPAERSGGLTGMRERAIMLGGQLRLESAAGLGTMLEAEIPLQKHVPTDDC